MCIYTYTHTQRMRFILRNWGLMRLPRLTSPRIYCLKLETQENQQCKFQSTCKGLRTRNADGIIPAQGQEQTRVLAHAVRAKENSAFLYLCVLFWSCTGEMVPTHIREGSPLYLLHQFTDTLRNSVSQDIWFFCGPVNLMPKINQQRTIVKWRG